MVSAPHLGFLVVAFFLIGIPLVCAVLCVHSILKSESKEWRAAAGVGVFVFVAWLFMASAHIIHVGPYRSGILISGISPEGREYLVVQTYRGLIEPYQVSFYAREADGTWRWHYLAHQDNAWRDVRVSFSDGRAVVDRNGEVSRELLLSDTQDEESLPAALTAEKVAQRHHDRYR